MSFLEHPIALSLNMLTLSVLALLALLAALFWQAAKRGLSCLDLITDKSSGRMSLTKVMNLFGGIVGAWVVMRMAIDKSLDWDVFAIYLAYCASTHGFSTWLSARYKPGEPAAASPAQAKP
jgi:hypothetical protein